MTFIEKTKRFFEPIKVIPRHVTICVVESIAMAGYYIFTFEMLRAIFHSLEQGNIQAFYSLLYWYSGITLILMTARFFMYKTGWTPIMYDGMKIYYRKYLNAFVSADGNSVEKIGSGRFITIIDRGVHTWLDAIFEISAVGVTNIVICFYAIYFIFTISNIWGVLALVLSLLSAYVATLANIWMAKKRSLRQNSHKEGTHQTVVALMSKNELLQNNGLETIMKKIEQHFEDAKIYQYPVNIGFLVIEEFPRLAFLFIRVSLYIYIANLIIDNNASFADFGIFITVITVMEKSLNEILHLSRNILRNLSSIELLWSTFDSLTPIKGYSTGLPFSKKPKDIEINSISYGYNETKVFDNFSLTIKRGQKTALVGASGGGKTTLMKLIAGYLHPEGGSISVLGNQLDETALRTYYPHIGYLTQDPGVFDATIRENLISAVSSVPVSVMSTESPVPVVTTRHPAGKSTRAGFLDSAIAPLEMTETRKSEDILEQKLIKALKLAHCDFVFELEHGLDTEIGERGVRLSGGQKQRLAIAKIFLKDPEIILLDEPTSALDSFSEEAITVALDELFKDRTVIIVAHRLQTVRKADDILVLEGGQVVERGTHTELVEKGGIYHRMLELQSGF